MKWLVEKIDSRSWPAEYVQGAIGPYIDTAFTFSRDENIRTVSTSGGTVTAILLHLLETGLIDGALVVSSLVEHGRVSSKFTIATSREQLLASRGSKYMPVYFNRDAAPLLRDFNGRIAAVLLPRDAQALAKLRNADPLIDAKVQFVITLFCGHNSERELTDAIVERFRPGDAPLVDFRHRFGHWRGKTRLDYLGHESVVVPFSEFSDYQNLFFFSQKKCHGCFDHFGYHSDIAIGDVWSQKMKSDPIKKNAVVIRNRNAANLIAKLARKELHVEAVTVADVCNGQSRTLPFHYNISARAKVGRVFGMTLKDRKHMRTKWNEVITAFLVLLNERITRSALGRRAVLCIPKPVLKAYLVFLKGLETFR